MTKIEHKERNDQKFAFTLNFKTERSSSYQRSGLKLHAYRLKFAEISTFSTIQNVIIAMLLKISLDFEILEFYNKLL